MFWSGIVYVNPESLFGSSDGGHYGPFISRFIQARDMARSDYVAPTSITSLPISTPVPRAVDWSDWSHWSACVGGSQERERCTSTGEWCEIEQQVCSEPVTWSPQWSSWSTWSSCSGGAQVRQRCKGDGAECQVEKQMCYQAPEVSPWSEWSDWSACRSGSQKRERCREDRTECDTEWQECYEARHVPFWSEWTQWSSCVGGVQRRRRCYEDGSVCEEDQKFCTLVTEAPRYTPTVTAGAPTATGWSEWSDWSECEDGVQFKERCKDRHQCEKQEQMCRVESGFDPDSQAEWSEWSPWGECDMVVMEMARSRCRDEFNCEEEYEYCEGTVGEGTWSEWGECAEGFHERERCGDYGCEIEEEGCSTDGVNSRQYGGGSAGGDVDIPPPNLDFVEWGRWEECNDGFRTREKCINNDCMVETDVCTSEAWSEWSPCGENGVKERTRCTSYSGCELEEAHCQQERRNSGHWSFWGPCKEGYQSREKCVEGYGCTSEERICDEVVSDWSDWGPCVGGFQEREKCSFSGCEVLARACKDQNPSPGGPSSSWWGPCVDGVQERVQCDQNGCYTEERPCIYERGDLRDFDFEPVRVPVPQTTTQLALPYVPAERTFLLGDGSLQQLHDSGFW